MEYDVLFKKITYLCAEMISSGGSCELIPRNMNMLCSRYGLSEPAFIINSNGVFATAVAPDGTNLTAICPICEIGQNFGKLHRFVQYCSTISEKLPTAEEIGLEIQKINGQKYLTRTEEYIASVFLGTGFAVLFGCGFGDAAVAAAVCVLIVAIGSVIRKFSTNLFFYNTVVCLFAESAILLAAKKAGICTHPESVSLGVIMLLISGLSFSDGLWSLINKDTAIGLYKMNSALIGAVGIIAGITTPLVLIGNVTVHGLSINKPLAVQVLACTFACAGFAVLCCVEKKHVPAVAAGAGLSWIVYTLCSRVTSSLFICMATATFAVILYALAVTKKMKLNPNITRIVGILPLVPGTNLFYTLYGAVTRNSELEILEATKLFTACLGISFGFTVGRLCTGLFFRDRRETKN